MDFEDCLKALDNIGVADKRNEFFNHGLEDVHYALSQCCLNKSVPQKVKVHFETAKNVSLYSWYVYRFHQVAEMTAYTALEMALREKYKIEEPGIAEDKLSTLTMKRLMDQAKKRQWLKNEKFPSLYARAKYAAQTEKMLRQSESHDFDRFPSMPIEEATESEIRDVLERFDLAAVVLQNTHKLRNFLAHDLTKMAPDSVGTLSLVSEVINQLFE